MSADHDTWLSPSHALAVCMGLHKRLGENSPVRLVCAEVLVHYILSEFDIELLEVKVFSKNHLHTLDVLQCQVLGSDPFIDYSVYPPTERSLLLALGSGPVGHSKTGQLLRRQQTRFFNNRIANLFGKFVILMQLNDFKPGDNWKDYRFVMWETSKERSVFGNDVAYIQGLIDGFLATFSLNHYQPGEGPIVVRPVEGRSTLQTFMFGNKVNRKAVLTCSTLRGPLKRISFCRKRAIGAERVRFANLAKVGVPVVCFLD